MTGFPVLDKRCDQCLYGPNKIVSNARRKEILQSLEERDDFFVCHKASIEGTKAACHGDWEQRQCGRTGRMAAHFDLVQFVAEADLPNLPKLNEDLDDARDDDAC